MLPMDRAVRVQEKMTGGQARGPNPPSATCTPIIPFNLSLSSSSARGDFPNQKTKRNGFTSYISRTTLNRILWRKSASWTIVSGSIMMTSENAGDVTVDNRSLRKPSLSRERSSWT